MATPDRPLVEELAREMDAILERKPGARKPLALTEENVRRVFGMSLWDLFTRLAERYGYERPEGGETKAPE